MLRFLRRPFYILACFLTALSTTAVAGEPLSVEESKTFMLRLAKYVHEHHLKKQADSPQRGMVYEYLDTTRLGQHDQFVQGEALDTMHDGSWLLAGLINAHRVTGEPFYREFIVDWTLPFYLKMLNHSDTLFNSKVNHARPDRQKLWRESKEWLLQDGEKGFVPYWWDDGGSISLEQRIDGKGPAFPCFDQYIASRQPNPQYRLSGYSFGSSNHLAQDLGVMLELAWLWLRERKEPSDQKLLAEVAEAAKNLQQCRLNHHGNIPAVVAPVGLVTGDPKLFGAITDWTKVKDWLPKNHYVQCLAPAKPGARQSTPGFADDQEYLYYSGIARHGGKMPEALAFRLIYDAFTHPQLYSIYCDETLPEPGINRFDLHPYYFKDGKPEDYQSDRKGPSGKPRPAGSRFGPQNMIVCGWALQALAEYPGIYDQRRKEYPDDVHVTFNSREQIKFTIGDAALSISSSRNELSLYGDATKIRTIKVFSHPDGQGSHKVVDLPENGGTMRVPYSIAKAEVPWANAYEHGRLSIQIGDTTKNLYFASSEAGVKKFLERELGEGLRTWQKIVDEKGYIPTSLGAGSFGGGYQLDNLSDSGGYAHLIGAAAQWIMYQQGKRDWEELNVPEVK